MLQDGSGGIVVRFEFGGDHNYALGEEIEVDISGQELSDYNGLVQVNNVPTGNAVSFGPGTLPEPREATISEILANGEAWESTLVLIKNVSFVESDTYEGSKTLDDGTGTLSIYTRSQASFSGSALPGGSFDMTAIVSDFNAIQVYIRNLDDIEE